MFYENWASLISLDSVSLAVLGPPSPVAGVHPLHALLRPGLWDPAGVRKDPDPGDCDPPAFRPCLSELPLPRLPFTPHCPGLCVCDGGRG